MSRVMKLYAIILFHENRYSPYAPSQCHVTQNKQKNYQCHIKLKHQRSPSLSRLTLPPCQCLSSSSLWSAFFHNNSSYESPPQDKECLLPQLSWFFSWFGWFNCYCHGFLQDNCNKPQHRFRLGVNIQVNTTIEPLCC